MTTSIKTLNALTFSVPDVRTATRVLVVGHDASTGAVLAEHLEAPGFEVETAAGGAEALNKIRQYPPDVQVVDATAPGLNHSDFGALCRAEGLSETPIVALSAGNQLTEVLTRPGVWVCLVKPVEEEVLVGAVCRIASFRSRANQGATLE